MSDQPKVTSINCLEFDKSPVELRILHLTLKKKWFDMILSGEKREEYREIKPYWIKRLVNGKYDAVAFRNGYNPDSPWMLVELKEIWRGQGVCAWGAPDRTVTYILTLGIILEKRNITERVTETSK